MGLNAENSSIETKFVSSYFGLITIILRLSGKQPDKTRDLGLLGAHLLKTKLVPFVMHLDKTGTVLRVCVKYKYTFET